MLKGKRKQKSKSKFSIIFRSVVKHVKIPYLILFIVMLSVNTFAWFIYSQRISTSVDVHVRGWKVMFSSREGTVSNLLHFSVTDMAPGMDDFEDYVTIYNDSEVSSRVRYNILEVDILDDTFITVEGKTKRGLTVDEDDMTSEELYAYLEDNYPFRIELELSDDLMTEEETSSTFTLTVSWPFDSGDDAEDTFWGRKAYDYMEENSTSNCIKLSVELIVEQINESSSSSDSSADSSSGE